MRIRLLILPCLPMMAACGLASEEPGDLAALVRAQQLRYVKESTGELAFQCFTDEDLREFRRQDVPAKAVSRLRNTALFRAVVERLRAMPQAERKAELDRARRLARPTWREMGYLARDGSGQTEAGHAADLLVAKAIVAAVEAELK